MRKRVLQLGGLLIFIVLASYVFHQMKQGGPSDSATEFSAKYIVSQDPYNNSVLVTTDDQGRVKNYEEFPVETGIEYSYLKQLGQQVYFDGYIAKTPSFYDYDTKEITTLPTLNKIYDVINPFSQQLFLTVNGGFAEEGLYNSGACYLADEWVCKEFESELAIRNGVMFNNKIFLYANTASPELDEDDNLIIEEKILVYDLSFNLLYSCDIRDNLGINDGPIEFYHANNKLFIFGTDEENGSFMILEVDENLTIQKKVSYPETDSKEREQCVPASRFSLSDDELFLEVLCNKSSEASDYQKGLYQEDNLLLKIDLNDIENANYEVFLYGDKRMAGFDFQNQIILLENRLYEGENIELDVYDANFSKLGTTTLESLDSRTPTLVDISMDLIKKDSDK
ncbi:MAG: hypothetical protein HFE54_00955 [Turicibacter sp.]|uniref:Uncharacterized protein n=1 Tax=Turicibacter faecis TaxID=2963365 RepID=A0ABN6ZKK2_9FIRM|nr:MULTISPECIES: hypothetical protein [unclassified Turicibacter]MCI8700927.1 hypothetical protein [Turicibacter sp.]BEH91458.1 hypothetical protein T23_15600 [Turicibacter sp. TC023]MCI9350492.1 hypothetical protein [Turicibacter sp.]MCU7204898.1 hypothetical protein [Turicibacter sp. TA25]MCU7208409.1 hypothetical protein [Turicibacter sp. 1E2]